MYRLVVVSMAATLLVPIAQAQQVFDGFNIGLGLGASHGSSSINIDSGDRFQNESGTQSFKPSKTNLTGSVSAGYSKSWGRVNAAVNVFYNIGSEDYGNATNVNGIVRQANISNVFGLSFEPGYYAAEDFLLYAKLGAAWSNLKITYPGYSEAELPSESFGTSTGFLYGLGVKYAFAKNWYVGAEVYQIAFGQKSLNEDSGNMYVNRTFKPTYNYAGVTLICIDQSSDCFKSFSVSWLKSVDAQRTGSETSGISDG